MATSKSSVGEQRDARHYDKKFEQTRAAARHYTQTEYYGLWTVILDRLRRLPRRRILEIGCGPGQLANAIRDMGLAESYLGLDFSKVAIERAQETNPGWNFRCADVFKDRSLEEEPYDALITTEFLEHVHEDLEVVRRIRPRTMVLASVPNFPWIEHVWHFRDSQEVHDRYSSYFDKLYVVPIRMQKSGATHFLMQGPRKAE